MTNPKPAPTDNGLFRSLSDSDQDRINSDHAMVSLEVGTVLAAQDTPLGAIYFPTGALIRLSQLSGTNDRLCIGMVGTEGMLGIGPALGVEALLMNATVQTSGGALRVESAVFRQHVLESRELRHLLGAYSCVLINQLGRRAACHQFHAVEQRLARILLMAQDGQHSIPLRLTQQGLAELLGVARAAVSISATSLQKRELIRYRHGRITVLDRAGLRQVSCACYADDRNHYRSIMGAPE